jgi:hypothetical protein
VARHLGNDLRTVTKLVTKKKLPYRLITAGKHQYCLFDREHLNVLTKHAGRLYSLRGAARMLGVPVNVLRELKRTGVYVSTYLCPSEFQFHSLDLQAFKGQLLALTPSAEVGLPSVGGEPFVTLAKIWRTHATPNGRAATVKALLDRRLPAIGNAEGTVSGLMISERQYKEFADDNRAQVVGYMPDEAAKELHCERETIAGLAKEGLLEGQPTPEGSASAEQLSRALNRSTSLYRRLLSALRAGPEPFVGRLRNSIGRQPAPPKCS